MVFLRPETRDVATRVSGRKWVQSTERDIVNGSFCNLCALVLCLALHILATQCWWVPIRAKQLSTVAIPLYSFLSCWCLETFFPKYQLCSLLSLYIFLADQVSCKSYFGSTYRMRSSHKVSADQYLVTISKARSPSLGACNYPIFLSRRFHRPIYF